VRHTSPVSSSTMSTPSMRTSVDVPAGPSPDGRGR
jgi:hypothetical protein